MKEDAAASTRFGPLDSADGHARITGPCGDTMEVWLKVDKGHIKEATFFTDGCAASIACGLAATRLARGSHVDKMLLIRQSDILSILGGLPEESCHCALLAADSLRAAVVDYYRRVEPH